MDQSYQKAAKLLIALDPDAARKLLSTFDEEEREKINYWIERTQSITNDDAEELLESFYHSSQEKNFQSNQLIQAIEKGDPNLIERLIKKEPPRAIAMLLPFLSTKTVCHLLFLMDELLMTLVISEAAHLKPEDIAKAKNTLENTWGSLPPFKVIYGLALVEGWYLSLNKEKKDQLQKTLHHIDPELEDLLLGHSAIKI